MSKNDGISLETATLTLPADVIAALDQRAREGLISRSAVARQLLAAALRPKQAEAM
jgi:metal-responsive CopG/Arc/MetJ family transcriptional regulator